MLVRERTVRAAPIERAASAMRAEDASRDVSALILGATTVDASMSEAPPG
jgi:hypothetical protein